jgi:two-component system, response regulator PdtaR
LTTFEAKPASAPVIIVVDDDALIRELVTLALRDAGFDVVEAQDAAEALEVLESLSPFVTALFSDIHMPGPLDGLALASHARRRWPNLGIVLASGRAMPTTTDLPARCHFLRKPFGLDDMVTCVRTVLSA